MAIVHKLLKSPETYKDDIVGYAENVLGVQLWAKQKEICEALIQHKRVIVESANAIGKSFIVAVIATWFHETHIPGTAVLTAPTERQITDTTFKEIRKMYRGPGLAKKANRIERTPNHKVLGYTAVDDTAFQGIHDENLLIVFEECIGIEGIFWNAARGVLAGGNSYWLAVCNPTDISSHAYTERESGEWHVIQISAFDHPNVEAGLKGEPEPIPGAITLQQLRDNIRSWCDEIPAQDKTDADFEFEGKTWRPGPIAEARLLGRYPTLDGYTVFTQRDFELASAKQEPTDAGQDQVEIGCDVARYGDDNTTIHVKRGNQSVFHESYNGRSTQYTATRLKELANQYAGDHAKKIPIRVDSAGIGGGLCDQKGGFNFVEVNAATVANDSESYPNKRSELLFTLAGKMRSGECNISFLHKRQQDELRRQALGITYKLDTKGKRVAEPKDKIKQRIGRSPDDLDAIALAYCGRSPKADLGAVIERLEAQGKNHDWKNELEIAKEQTQVKPGGSDMAAEVHDSYKHVRRIVQYGTYQAYPLLRGVPTPLIDYPSQHEAAFAVNVAHRLTGLDEPNKLVHAVPAERQKAIEVDVIKKLEHRRIALAPVPKPEEPAADEKKEKKKVKS